MKTLFIVDPIAGLKPYKDSSIDMMLTAQLRGHTVLACGLDDVFHERGTVFANARPVTLDLEARAQKAWGPASGTVGDPQRIAVAEIGAVFIRPDPPFDSRYLALTYLLDGAAVRGGPVWVNHPAGVRALNEKLSALAFSQFMPTSLIAFDSGEIRRFAAEFGTVVMKSVYFGGGTGVVKVQADAPDMEAQVALLRDMAPAGPVLVQEFLPEVAEQGDIRVMVVAGTPRAAVGRRPAAGEFRANIAMGGTETAVELSRSQTAIAAEVGTALWAQGILFAGIDLIGEKLIEINVTSPTLIQELRRVSGVDVSALILDAVEHEAARPGQGSP